MAVAVLLFFNVMITSTNVWTRDTKELMREREREGREGGDGKKGKGVLDTGTSLVE